LKGRDDNKALWNGLINDAVSTTATDEFPTSLDHKLSGKRIDNVTGGNLGAEARMGIVYTEGVVKRGMTLQRFADVTSTNAARILGLYPRKGVIAAGSDADIVLIDPSIKKKLTREDFHVSDYSPWEGWEVAGMAGDYDIARQGNRRKRQAAGKPGLRAADPAQGGSGGAASSGCLKRPAAPAAPPGCGAPASNSQICQPIGAFEKSHARMRLGLIFTNTRSSLSLTSWASRALVEVIISTKLSPVVPSAPSRANRR